MEVDLKGTDVSYHMEVSEKEDIGKNNNWSQKFSKT